MRNPNEGKTQYKRRYEAGVCTRCGTAAPKKGRTVCRNCQMAINEWQRKKRLKDRKKNGKGGRKCRRG